MDNLTPSAQLAPLYIELRPLYIVGPDNEDINVRKKDITVRS